MKKDEKPYKILLIEDNPGDALLLEEYAFEYIQVPEIIHVNTWEEGRKVFAEKDKSFDIVLLDLSLPDASGESLIHEVIEIAGAAPVVALTGYSDLQFGIKSLSWGITDYLIKDELSGISLYKSIVYNIERKRYINEVEESEKKYLELFQLTPLPMWLCETKSHRIIEANEAAVSHYGYTEEEFMQMSFDDLSIELIEIPNGENGHEGSVLPIDLKKKENIRQHKTKSGKEIKVKIVSKPVNERQHQILIAHDITELSNYIQAVQVQNRKLRDIAWTQSHIVRGPLSRIMGLVNLAGYEDYGGFGIETLLDLIMQSAQELDAVIKDIVEKSQEELI